MIKMAPSTIVAQGENGPRELLVPAEVWVHIFGFLGPENLSNVSLAYTQFSDYLKKQKPTYLIDQTLPVLQRYLEWPEIVKCRAVCKSWEKAVDTVLEDHFEAFTEDKIKELKRHGVDRREFKVCNFQIEKLAQFNTQMIRRDCPRRRNPLIAKGFSIVADKDYQFSHDRNTYSNVLTELADFRYYFGQHLHHFSFEMSSYFSRHDWNVEQLSLFMDFFLRKFPNLKSLKFYVDNVQPMSSGAHDRELACYIDSNFQTRLPQLESLYLCVSSNSEADNVELGIFQFFNEFFLEIHSYQLKKLGVPARLWNPEFCWNEKLDEVRELTIDKILSFESLQLLTFKTTFWTGINLPALIKLELGMSITAMCIKHLMVIIGNIKFVAPKLQVVQLTLDILPPYDDERGPPIGLFFLEKGDRRLKGLRKAIRGWFRRVDAWI